METYSGLEIKTQQTLNSDTSLIGRVRILRILSFLYKSITYCSSENTVTVGFKATVRNGNRLCPTVTHCRLPGLSRPSLLPGRCFY